MHVHRHEAYRMKVQISVALCVTEGSMQVAGMGCDSFIYD